MAKRVQRANVGVRLALLGTWNGLGRYRTSRLSGVVTVGILAVNEKEGIGLEAASSRTC
jgi:hypothetical protein